MKNEKKLKKAAHLVQKARSLPGQTDPKCFTACFKDSSIDALFVAHDWSACVCQASNKCHVGILQRAFSVSVTDVS